jgi:hypothetical protein
MPRRLKPSKVDVIEHKTFGVKLDLMFDRNPDKLDFFATFGAEEYRSRNPDELKTLLRKKIEEASKLEWAAAIVVDTKGGHMAAGSGLTISFERYWWARKLDGKILRADWAWGPNCADEDQQRQRRFRDEDPTADLRQKHATEMHWWEKSPRFEPPVAEHNYYGRAEAIPDKTHLPYTEETWAALGVIQDSIRTLKGQLAAIIHTEEGRAGLQAFGEYLAPKALMAGTPVYDEDEE